MTLFSSSRIRRNLAASPRFLSESCGSQNRAPATRLGIDFAASEVDARVADLVREQRYGLIEVVAPSQVMLRFRRFAKLVTVWSVLWAKIWTHARTPGDSCRLYYDAPRSCPGFVIIKLMTSHRNTSYRSTRKAMAALDRIATLRNSTAIVFHASNARITEQVMQRFGYERHAKHLPGRHFIKRFANAVGTDRTTRRRNELG